MIPAMVTPTTSHRVASAHTLKLPTDPHGPALPLVLGDRYRLIARLGGGGMANVYRGIDTHLDRNIAVKLMTPKLRSDPEFDMRFRREAQIVSKLNDPHIIVVHDFGLDAMHGPYLVMELLEGQTLRERLNARGALPLVEGLQLGEQIMLALAHAHGLGVIHRDLKPDNVFLLAQSGVKLHVRVLDFGIARMVQQGNAPELPDATLPGSTVGTPRYMAPEQLAGKGASEQSDIYSAALVLYESLTGQLPDVLGPRLREKCPDAPDDLVRIIEQCLQSNPDDRPVTAAEVYLHLHELVRESGSDLLISDTAVAQLTARFRKKDLIQAEARAHPNRRRIITATIAFGLLAASTAWLARPRSYPHPDVETVVGIALGESRDDVVARLGKPQKADDPAEALKPFATPAELMKAGDTQSAEVLLWPGQGVTVALVGSEVRAVIARHSPAATAANLRIGDSETTWRRAYPDSPTACSVLPPTVRNPRWGLLFQYSDLKLSVELRDGAVTGLALVTR
ncbi:MAG: serine/threonine protein kinase [Gemmataceae bacterium]|nr:serine/threonine protein kinase [Gemmataceae bacterium]